MQPARLPKFRAEFLNLAAIRTVQKRLEFGSQWNRSAASRHAPMGMARMARGLRLPRGTIGNRSEASRWNFVETSRQLRRNGPVHVLLTDFDK